MPSGSRVCAACTPHPRVRSTNLSRRSWIACGESSTTRCAREPDFFRAPALRIIRVSVLSAKVRPIPSHLPGRGPSVGAWPAHEYAPRMRAILRSVPPSFPTVEDREFSPSFASSCPYRLRSVPHPHASIKTLMPPDPCRAIRSAFSLQSSGPAFPGGPARQSGCPSVKSNLRRCPSRVDWQPSRRARVWFRTRACRGNASGR